MQEPLTKLLSWVLQNSTRGAAAEIARNTSTTAAELSMHVNGRRPLSANKLVEVMDYLLQEGVITFKADLG
jgi:hypothetical protein